MSHAYLPRAVRTDDIGSLWHPVIECFGPGNHIDTIDGTRINAQITSCTVINNHCVHQFRRADNCVNWAGLYAFRATNTFFLDDDRNQILFSVGFICIEWA
jgi:hypothetical protein